MLNLSGLSKSYGSQVLFDKVDLQLNRRERLGVVGPNGAGKSTLFSIILGETQPDAGRISMERRVTMGYLAQETMPSGDQTVLATASTPTPEMAKLRQQVEAWEAGHAKTEDEHLDLHARFEAEGGYELEPRAKRILAGLGFRTSDHDRSMNQLSGGWVMRVHLARLLVQQPDLLLLDEPTNHLDLLALLWLQDYLKTYSGAMLLISHDREFLNEVVVGILEIGRGGMTRYTGTYEDYLVQRAARAAQQAAAFRNQQREIARLQSFADRFRAKASKASQAQSKLKQIDRIERLDAPDSELRTLQFQFPQPQRSGQQVITLKDIHFSYGDTPVYQGLNYQAERGQRIVLIGPNGAGKSTLLKLLAGVVDIQKGSRTLGHNVKPGYFSQYRVDQLQTSRSVLEEALESAGRVTEQTVRSLLGCFLFRGDDVFKKVGVLSGGEKSRLALVKLLLDPPNLLIMDEPTTHLDIPSVEALLEAMKQFQGTLIFISHDVYFIRSLADRVVEIADGEIREMSGGYQYYQDQVAAREKAAGAQRPDGTVTGAPKRDRQSERERKHKEAQVRKQRSSRLKPLRASVLNLEQQIHTMEARVAELTKCLQNPATYGIQEKIPDLGREMKQLTVELHHKIVQWEDEAGQLADLESDSV